MKPIFTLLFFVFTITASAQKKISGKVLDNAGQPLPAANVFIEGTYDGTTTDAEGNFTFETSEKGAQVLVITFLAYDDLRQNIVVENYKPQNFTMRENVNTLDAVVISAGTFSAGDNTKVSALKPLDIVTTAGSAGDIVAALNTLPGTQTVGESGRLFVRGGESDETQTYVDGIRVAQPYGATANNLPTRGRFSPFLFSGMTFSTGGYSAEFGEALSSVLLLNTIDEPVQEQTDIAFMTVGLGLGNTQKWEKSSLSFNSAYINLQPYQWLVPQNVEWNKPYQSFSGETVYRYKTENGLFKAYAAFDHSDFDLYQDDINRPTPTRVDIANDNLYFNSSYSGVIGTGLSMTAGASYGYSKNDINLNADTVDNGEHSSHLKLKFRKTITSRIKLAVGGDYFITDFNEDYREQAGFAFSSGYTNRIAAGYAEGDVFFSKNFAAKAGLRVSNSSVISETSVEPRVSLAYKVSSNSQFSFAYGDFYQTPRQDYLKYYQNFEHEKTAHYILNYMYNVEGKTLRAEAYYKDYDNLVKFDANGQFPYNNFTNGGSGFAKGIDLFWRDNKTFKNLEYWISYSFIDTQRNYRDYPTTVTPSFAAKHNFSIVGKYWVEDWKSQISLTHTFNSGRPYNNPNSSEFMAGHTRNFNNLSFSWAYLLTQQKILFLSVTNVLGTENVFGYNYANNAGPDGTFARQPITQPADRFFFIGFFWTLSDNKSTNQLNNL